MTDKEFFVETLRDEVARFDRVNRALPQSKFSHTHHPKSKTAEELVMQMAGEVESFMEFLKDGKTDWAAKFEKPEDFETLFKNFVESMNRAADFAAEMSEEEWSSEAIATLGEQEVWRTTRGKMAWGLLFDLIHHRGQLSTYIRPMGGKVPSIYGPSGDEVGM